jgi:hypothetical protein
MFDVSIHIQEKKVLSYAANQNKKTNASKTQEVVRFKTTKNIYFDLEMHSYFFLALGTQGSKCIYVSSHYLFICEREIIVRIFDKRNGRYLTSIKNHCANKLAKTNITDFNNPVDMCGDPNGNLYIAYGIGFEVYNSQGEFVWKHDIVREMGSILRVSINNNGSIAFITRNQNNERSKNRLFIYP